MKRAKSQWKGKDAVVRLKLEGCVLFEARAKETVFPVTIGRGRDNTWVVPDAERAISSHHAEIAVRRGRELVVRDVGSRNGIFVLGERKTECVLAVGQTVSIGRMQLSMEIREDDGAQEEREFHRLEVVTGPDAGRMFDIDRETMTLGKRPAAGQAQCDLPLASALASRRHAEISIGEDGRCRIKDLGSTNGTYVNGLQIKGDNVYALRNDDLIAIADVELRFHDRRTPDPWLNWRKVFAVVLATGAVCCTAYFAWQWMFPSAREYLREAQAYEVAGEFDAAMAVLERAAGARGAEEYAGEIARKKSDAARWKATVAAWNKVQSLIDSEKWAIASQELGALLDTGVENWGWNTTTAPALKKKAAATRRIVKALLDARSHLSRSTKNQTARQVYASLKVHEKALKSALASPEWDESLHTGTLREVMGEQLIAISATVRDLDEIDALMAPLCESLDGGGDVDKDEAKAAGVLGPVMARTEKLRRTAAAIKAVGERSAAREKDRRKFLDGKNWRYVASPAVADACDRYAPALEKLAAARDVLAANAAAVATMSERPLAESLPLPSEAQLKAHRVFSKIAGEMQRANKELCQVLSITVPGQIKRLRRRGYDGRRPPECMETISSESAMAKVFACDSMSLPFFDTRRTERMGMYDAVLGCEAFHAFMAGVGVEDGLPEYEDAMGNLPRPALLEAIAFCRQMRKFRTALANPDWMYLAGLDTPGENVLRAYSAGLEETLRCRRLLIQQWWNEPQDSVRSEIIAKGAALALDGGETLNERHAAEVKAMLDSLRMNIKRLQDELNANFERVDEIRPKILKIGLPRFFGVDQRWRQATEMKEVW